MPDTSSMLRVCLLIHLHMNCFHDMLHTAYNSSFKQYLFGIVNHCLRLSGIRWRTDTLTRMKRVRRMVKRVTRNVTLRHRLMPSSDKKCCLQCRLDQLLLCRIVACSIVQKHAVFHIFLSLSVTLGIECWFKPFVWLFTYLDHNMCLPGRLLYWLWAYLFIYSLKAIFCKRSNYQLT